MKCIQRLFANFDCSAMRFLFNGEYSYATRLTFMAGDQMNILFHIGFVKFAKLLFYAPSTTITNQNFNTFEVSFLLIISFSFRLKTESYITTVVFKT